LEDRAVDNPDDPIHEAGQLPRAGKTVLIGKQPLLGLGPAFVKETLDLRHQPRAQSGSIADRLIAEAYENVVEFPIGHGIA
jgi:hypothetical protein